VRIIEHFYSFLAPQDCLVCGQEGSLLCKGCAATSLSVISGRCYRCYRVSSSCLTCPSCRNYSVLKHVWIRSEYNKAAKQLIHSFKFNYAKDAAVRIAEELASILPKLQENTIIVHIPVASSHFRQRGF